MAIKKERKSFDKMVKNLCLDKTDFVWFENVEN